MIILICFVGYMIDRNGQSLGTRKGLMTLVGIVGHMDLMINSGHGA
jgi:hypothetical protein